MDQNPKGRAYRLTIIGGIILILSFAVYYQLMYGIDNNNVMIIEIVDWLGLQHNNASISVIYSRGMFLGISTTFLGLGKLHEKTKIRVLIYFPISSFFFILFLTYTINDIATYIGLDYIFETNKIIVSFLITTILCFLYYFRR